MAEILSQIECASARCCDVVHIVVPFDASLDVTDAQSFGDAAEPQMGLLDVDLVLCHT